MGMSVLRVANQKCCRVNLNILVIFGCHLLRLL